MSREHTGDSKHPLPTTQEKTLHMDITRQSILKSDWLHSLQPRWRSIQSAKTRPGSDCGSDHELLIAKFRLKLKTVGKSARPFRYDLNQIPYVYTVDLTGRFKGLYLMDTVPEELCTEVHDTVQVAVIKIIPKKEKHKKAKRLLEEAVWTAEKRTEAKGKGENVRYTHLSREDKSFKIKNKTEKQ